MTAYHLPEWVWGGFLKGNFTLQAQLKLASNRRATCEDFLRHIIDKCPALSDAQSVTNGTKQLIQELVSTGEHKGAFQRGAFQTNSFDVSYLWIARSNGRQEVCEFVNELVSFWSAFFRDHRVP
jgi:hypothetical protein